MDRRVAAAVIVLVLIAAAAALILLQPRPAPPPPAQNLTQPLPQPAPADNASEVQAPPPPPPPPPPVIQQTNESIGQLLDDGLSRGGLRFKALNSSLDYDIASYRWQMSNSSTDAPDAIPLKANDIRASEVRFPDHYIDSLRGFAFTSYEPKQLAGPMKLYGVAVFLANSTQLDDSPYFNATYDPSPMLSQTLEGCMVIQANQTVSPDGNPIRIYDFSCKLIYGANP